MASMRWILLVLVLAGCGPEPLQPDGPTPPMCVVIDGVRLARVSAGPDGWCDYDGLTCACHGHGVGDQCEQAVTDFHEACDGTKGAL
jgi:hypothetical protein